MRNSHHSCSVELHSADMESYDRNLHGLINQRISNISSLVLELCKRLATRFALSRYIDKLYLLPGIGSSAQQQRYLF